MNHGWLILVLIMHLLQCSPIGMLACHVRGYSQCVIHFRMWPVNLSVSVFFFSKELRPYRRPVSKVNCTHYLAFSQNNASKTDR